MASHAVEPRVRLSAPEARLPRLARRTEVGPARRRGAKQDLVRASLPFRVRGSPPRRWRGEPATSGPPLRSRSGSRASQSGRKRLPPASGGAAAIRSPAHPRRTAQLRSEGARIWTSYEVQSNVRAEMNVCPAQVRAPQTRAKLAHGSAWPWRSSTRGAGSNTATEHARWMGAGSRANAAHGWVHGVELTRRRDRYTESS